MTQEQTRQLGIEFERRLHEVYPTFTLTEKLDTDTIYSFLSEYQTVYIKQLYLADSQLQRGTRASKKLNDTVKTLVRHKTISASKENIDADGNTAIFNTPKDYFLYIRSNSVVDSNYKFNGILFKSATTPNYEIKQDDVANVIDSFYNKHAIIRNPLVVIESTDNSSPYIKVIHDEYTNIAQLDLVYYCYPYAFNVIKYNDDNKSDGAVHSYCELPFSCFDELVQGALDMYITQYKFKLTSANARQKAQENQTQEAGRNEGNQNT